MLHPLHAVSATLAVAAGLAACGGETLTKDEYVKQADAICKKYQERAKALVTDPKTVADVEKLAEKTAPLFKDEISELRDLKAPDEIEEQVKATYELLDQQVARLEEVGDAAGKNNLKKLNEIADSAGKLSSEADAKAKEIGLKVCGSSS